MADLGAIGTHSRMGSQAHDTPWAFTSTQQGSSTVPGERGEHSAYAEEGGEGGGGVTQGGGVSLISRAS